MSQRDVDRVNWLVDNHPDDHTHTISSLIRALILREFERLQPKSTD